jgi:hypothetical protein
LNSKTPGFFVKGCIFFLEQAGELLVIVLSLRSETCRSIKQGESTTASKNDEGQTRPSSPATTNVDVPAKN